MNSTDAEIVSELNDLLQLDQDAVQAYTAAIEVLENERHELALIRYRGDHQRHIVELSRLIRCHGGEPLDLPHLPAGPFQSGVQAVARLGRDREILSVFKANEGQVRDEYRRHADAAHPPEIAAVLRRNAEDEEKHYNWAEDALEQTEGGAPS